MVGASVYFLAFLPFSVKLTLKKGGSCTRQPRISASHGSVSDSFRLLGPITMFSFATGWDCSAQLHHVEFSKIYFKFMFLPKKINASSDLDMKFL